MLMPRIIPCLDVLDGRVVKGTQFRNLRDAGDPVACARSYADQGADELVVLDISATLEARRNRLEIVRDVRAALPIPLTVGGGVRDIDDAEQLLAAGADKIAINTAAVDDPDRIQALADRFGRQCIVLSLDARRDGDRFQVVIRSGSEPTGLDAADWAANAVERGAGEILLTSQDRDGTRDGYDVELIAAVRAAVRVPIVASGGAANVAHLLEALDAGADAVLAASIFHDGDLTVADVKRELARAGVAMRGIPR